MEDKLKAQITSYRMSSATADLVTSVPIVMVVSVTGGGKNTVIAELLKTGQYYYVVSHTTRQPRTNNGVTEENGKNYWFTTSEELLQQLQEGKFVEAKVVHGSHVYGTSVAEFSKAKDCNQTALMEIDVQGVEVIKQVAPQAQAVFLLPPSFDVWMERLQQRGITQGELQQRLASAEVELTFALQSGLFEFVVNDDLPETVAALQHQRYDDHYRQLVESLLQQIKNARS